MTKRARRNVLVKFCVNKAERAALRAAAKAEGVTVSELIRRRLEELRG